MTERNQRMSSFFRILGMAIIFIGILDDSAAAIGVGVICFFVGIVDCLGDGDGNP